MAEHKDLTGDKVHTPFRWVFDDATARLAEAVTSDDVGKIAWQLDNNTLWALSAASPVTWKSIGGGGVLTTAGDILYLNGDGVLTRLPIGADGKILSPQNGLPAWVDLEAGGDMYSDWTCDVLTDETGTYINPAGNTTLIVEPQAGGGGTPSLSASGGLQTGGARAGAWARVKITGLTGGESISYAVGRGGLKGSVDSAGNDGGSSSFGTYVSCEGGPGGRIVRKRPIASPEVAVSGAQLLMSSSGEDYGADSDDLPLLSGGRGPWCNFTIKTTTASSDGDDGDYPGGGASGPVGTSFTRYGGDGADGEIRVYHP